MASIGSRAAMAAMRQVFIKVYIYIYRERDENMCRYLLNRYIFVRLLIIMEIKTERFSNKENEL